jgi:hypothetical protein
VFVCATTSSVYEFLGRDSSYPISIPSHTTDLNKFTARNTLNQLESDLDEFEEIYAYEKQEDPDDETIQQED